MNRVIVLDSGPVGLITNPKLSPESIACTQWLQAHITAGSRTIIPEIVVAIECGDVGFRIRSTQPTDLHYRSIHPKNRESHRVDY